MRDQEDAHEYFAFIVDNLHTELLKLSEQFRHLLSTPGGAASQAGSSFELQALLPVPLCQNGAAWAQHAPFWICQVLAACQH